jgi:2-methylaconitate cis-trans-isomerase PrpF
VRGSRCGGNEIEHPPDPAERDDLLLRILGSPDPRQIDGLGGAHPLTSKVAIVSRAKDADADIDFLFAQVGVDKALGRRNPQMRKHSCWGRSVSDLSKLDL